MWRFPKQRKRRQNRGKMEKEIKTHTERERERERERGCIKSYKNFQVYHMRFLHFINNI